ncbi:hypothetical protein SESBI_31804 [Sesbania bispinosa]|nr:hypothetical protein SESBI_31804 [Sesbania bispinosa]
MNSVVVLYDEKDIDAGIEIKLLKKSHWKWSRGQSLENVDFTKVLVRVQLWSPLPIVELGRWVSRLVLVWEQCKNLMSMRTENEGTYVRILVEINIQKPLMSGIPVGSQKDGVTWWIPNMNDYLNSAIIAGV